MDTNFIGVQKQNAYAAKGPVDAALAPVENLAKLNEIADGFMYDGMTVTVLKTDDGQSVPIEYFLYNGAWKIKKITPLKSYAVLRDSLPSDYRYYLVGLKAVVRKDETNDNKMTEYQVTNISIKDKTVTWEKVSGSAALTISGDDVEI